MIAIVDYRAGNLTSVARALHYLGQPYMISGAPAELDKATHVIFPGVGAAGDAMDYLREKCLDDWLKKWAMGGKPLLGICLGTQIIFESSEEDNAGCLGIVPGHVKRFSTNLQQNGQSLKIPHMGWNQVAFQRNHPVFQDLPGDAEFYFVHSYYPVPADDRWIIGLTDYGISFCSAIAHQNLVAVQFHPEKSGRLGLQILSNFCCWSGENAQ